MSANDDWEKQLVADHRRFLDALFAPPTKEHNLRRWVHLWLEYMTDADVDRLLKSAALHYKLRGSTYDVTAIRSKSDISTALCDLGITPEELVENGLQPRLSNDNERRPATVIQFRAMASATTQFQPRPNPKQP